MRSKYLNRYSRKGHTNVDKKQNKMKTYKDTQATMYIDKQNKQTGSRDRGAKSCTVYRQTE